MKTYQVCRECGIRWVQHDKMCARCARGLGVSPTGRKMGRPRKEPPRLEVPIVVVPAFRSVVVDGVEFEVVWP